LRDAIVDEFEVEAVECEADLCSFLDEMVQIGLVDRRTLHQGGV
jgi:hypothetical protein